MLSPEDYKVAVEKLKKALKKKKSNTETQTTQDNQSLSTYIANLNENKQSIRHINNFIFPQRRAPK